MIFSSECALAIFDQVMLDDVAFRVVEVVLVIGAVVPAAVPSRKHIRAYLVRVLGTFGRVASEDCSPEAPTEPDMQISRIRLFGPRFRYATIAGRI